MTVQRGGGTMWPARALLAIGACVLVLVMALSVSSAHAAESEDTPSGTGPAAGSCSAAASRDGETTRSWPLPRLGSGDGATAGAALSVVRPRPEQGAVTQDTPERPPTDGVVLDVLDAAASAGRADGDGESASCLAPPQLRVLSARAGP
ncbi:hypothetical protein [Cellulomonas fengjieae]|uniref:Secreted protein n=1 Tax=Cellulomonas fengjieae TaxID=2819978 RepID=A0ABS3SCH2_9CELL|nr:hypothetical protein [Cellulomonas fengjieae]MBO3083445.1 hypothetical protein [Cellulomonas fengjieae]QVI65224.1 hypothetical protein KG102_13990 [Cellulomonas fengjieae]